MFYGREISAKKNEKNVRLRSRKKNSPSSSIMHSKCFKFMLSNTKNQQSK